MLARDCTRTLSHDTSLDTSDIDITLFLDCRNSKMFFWFIACRGAHLCEFSVEFSVHFSSTVHSVHLLNGLSPYGTSVPTYLTRKVISDILKHKKQLFSVQSNLVTQPPLQTKYGVVLPLMYLPAISGDTSAMLPRSLLLSCFVYAALAGQIQVTWVHENR
jgi:hypothetical protein